MVKDHYITLVNNHELLPGISSGFFICTVEAKFSEVKQNGVLMLIGEILQVCSVSLHQFFVGEVKMDLSSLIKEQKFRAYCYHYA